MEQTWGGVGAAGQTTEQIASLPHPRPSPPFVAFLPPPCMASTSEDDRDHAAGRLSFTSM